jgi:hypothetical protein
MKKMVESRIFIAAFLLTYFSFFLISVVILDLKSEGLGAGHFAHGFPFTYFYSHCFGGYYLWFGLLGNIGAAAALAFAAGLSAVYLHRNLFLPFRRKVAADEFRRKWYL